MNTITAPEGFDDSAIEDMMDYLDALRESGATNMFGAASWLEADFDLDKKKARLVLAYWMDTFGTRHSEEEA